MDGSISYTQTHQVLFHVSRSDGFAVTAGIPQSCILGPTLFSLYTYDLQLSNYILTVQNADDITLLAQTSHNPCFSTLQIHLLAIQRWSDLTCLILNLSKCHHPGQSQLYSRSSHIYPFGHPSVQADESSIPLLLYGCRYAGILTEG